MHPHGMTESMHQFLADADRFGTFVDRVARWDAPSPCEGWDAEALLDHIIETQRQAITGQGIDLLDQAPGADPTARWAEHRATIGPVLLEDPRLSVTYEGWFGPTTLAETLSRFYGFDLLVHRWDLATSQGQDADLTDEELDRVEQGIESFGDAMYQPGISAPAITVPDDAPRLHRILGRVGREAA